MSGSMKEDRTGQDRTGQGIMKRREGNRGRVCGMNGQERVGCILFNGRRSACLIEVMRMRRPRIRSGLMGADEK